MWQVVSGIGVLSGWFATCKWRQHPWNRRQATAL
jgi:hypothetical protein